jgi:large subunit ribosomal protein L17
MAAQGRKNVHGKAGVRFKAAYTTGKRRNLLRNVVTELVKNEKVTVTYSVVAPLVKEASNLITLAKRGDLHARRQAASVLRAYTVDEKGTLALEKLFNDLGKRFEGVNGGYVRVLKMQPRKGDNAELRLITWSK